VPPENNEFPMAVFCDLRSRTLKRRRRQALVLVQAEQRAVAEHVHGVVQVRVGVLVDHPLGVEGRLRTTGC
jgi:hypothetical protein